MRACEACGREFNGSFPDCSWCGFNNARRGGPRSKRTLAELAEQREERMELAEELAEMSEDERQWWGWAEVAAERWNHSTEGHLT